MKGIKLSSIYKNQVFIKCPGFIYILFKLYHRRFCIKSMQILYVVSLKAYICPSGVRVTRPFDLT